MHLREKLIEKPVEKILFNEVEAAEVLQCSVHKLRVERGRGVGCNYIKMGRRVLYRSEDVIQHINNHMVVVAK